MHNKQIKLLFGAFIASLLLIFVVTGCQSTRAAEEHPQIASYALPQTEKTSMGEALQADVRAHPGASGIRILDSGSESYALRLGLIRAAEKTLDLQYYSMHDDTTANLLLEAIVRAAQRGVRIRFLIDSINIAEVAETMSILDEFKNVEIRVFNPFSTRDDGIFARLMKATVNLEEFNRRMHNKALISDNQMAIIGGRNLGDEYFEENTDVTFKDIDVLSAGPVTAAISASFDNYWNDKNAVPIGQLKKPKRDMAKIKNIRSELAAHWEEVRATEKGRKLLDSKLFEYIKDANIAMTWAPAELLVDSPRKIDKEETGAADSKPLMRLDKLLERAEKDFIAISPYFVPREDGVEWLAGIVKRGVRVRVITNSLASTDVVAVHTGYRDYRKAVVESGIELYEMKATGGERPPQRLLGRSAPAQASLHAKVYVIDSREVMVGSFNLDPRSIELNTEIALVIHSPEIAAQIEKMFDEVTDPDISYRLSLQKTATGEELVWKGRDKGKDVTYTSEPHPGFWRTVQVNLMDLLPIEDAL